MNASKPAAASLRPPTVVIFDMDGTAVRHINPRLLHILEWLDDAHFRIARFFGWLFRRGAKGPIMPDFEAFHNRRKPRLLVHRAMHRVRRKEVDEIVEPCPGIYTVLDLLEGHGIPLALVSSGLGKGYGHDILQKFDLERYFRAAVFREDIIKSKPNPEPLLAALGSLGVSLTPADCVWYIGDRRKDVLAALDAGTLIPARVEPIAYNLHAALAIVERGISPDNIIMSYYDMHMLLRGLLGDAPPGKAAVTAAGP